MTRISKSLIPGLFLLGALLVTAAPVMADDSPPAAASQKHFCPNCGQELASAVKFCTNCGAKLA